LNIKKVIVYNAFDPPAPFHGYTPWSYDDGLSDHDTAWITDWENWASHRDALKQQLDDQKAWCAGYLSFAEFEFFNK